MSRRLAFLVLAMYPLAFRRRYEPELRALLEDAPVRPAAVVDLLRGALVAHLRPVGGDASALSADDRLRTTSAGVLACWVAFAAAGFGFYKTTEDPAFGAAGHDHVLLGASHLAVQILAAVGALAVVLGALPLATAALGNARRERRLRAVTVVPLGALLTFVGVTAGLVAVAHAHHSEHTTTAGGVAFIAWGLAGLACSAICVSAARRALFATPVSHRRLAAAAASGALVTTTMVAMAIATGLYTAVLVTRATSLAHAPDGPYGVVPTTVALVAHVAVMVVAGTLATTATRRGWHAVRKPSTGEMA
jgi:hypothetical protein